VRIDVPISVTIPRFTDVPMIGTPVRVDGRLRPAGGSVHTAAYLQRAGWRSLGTVGHLAAAVLRTVDRHGGTSWSGRASRRGHERGR